MLFEFDKSVLLWIQENVRCEALTGIMKLLSNIGNKGILWIVIAFVFICTKKYRKAGRASAIALILSLIVCNLCMKNIVDRERPFDRIKELVLIGKRMTDYSFPSGHTTAAFATLVVYKKTMSKKFSKIMLVISILMAFSRLYLGAHYLTDVLAGVIIGSILGMLAMVLEGIYDKKVNKDKEEKVLIEEKDI
jgi:undecaprenyl-diphosphatase